MNILIVDDNPISLKLLRINLQPEGFQIYEAENGLKALEILERFPIDMIVSDILMPKMDGFTLCYEIRRNQKLKNLPIILFTTTYFTKNDEKIALDAGANKFLSKMATSKELIQSIYELLASKNSFENDSLTPDPTIIKNYSGALVRKLEERNLVLENMKANLIRINKELALRQEELEASETKFRQLTENIHDVFWISDIDLQKVIYISPAYEEIWQEKCTFLYANPQHWSDSIHPEDRTRVLQDFLTVGALKVCQEKYRIIRKDGSIRWIEAKSFPILNSKGVPYRIGGVAVDITERKKAEDTLVETNRRLSKALNEIQQTQEKMIQQERLHALGEMTSGIAHDFNNSLSPIVGFSQLLLNHPEKMEDREKLKLYLKIINTAALDAAKIVSRLREFYHVEKVECFLPIDLNEIISQSIILTQPKWKDQPLSQGINIEVKTNFQILPLFQGNESEIREMLTNLIFNAVDAIVEKNKNSQHEKIFKESIEISTALLENEILLSINDTGTGMTEMVKKRCLEPFFTTKGKNGTGLGLAMVYGIVQRHAGTIDIESNLNQGTTFIIHFPLHSTTTEKIVLPLTPRDSLIGKLHILVVDDEPKIAEFLREYLTDEGHTLKISQDGMDAFEKFQTERFDLVITDKSMPGISGDELASMIYRTNPNIPIILLTGFGDILNSLNEKPLGISLILCKPVTIETLREAIAKVVGTKS